jgi:hypothetical protein
MLEPQQESPTFPQLHFVFRLIQEFGARAFLLDFVQEALVFLQDAADDTTIPAPLRTQARELWQQCLEQLLHRFEKPALFAMTLHAFCKRDAMLKKYEDVYGGLLSLAKHKKKWNNAHAHLLKLQETFQDVPKERLQDWQHFTPERFALHIVGFHFASTAATVRKVLQQARKERALLRKLCS